MENENKTNRIFVIFLAFLYAVITTGVLSLVLLIPFDYQTCAVVCFVTIFLLSVMSINKKFFRITFSLIIVAVIAFVVVVNKGGRLYIVQQTIYDYGKWIWQALTSFAERYGTFFELIGHFNLRRRFLGLLHPYYPKNPTAFIGPLLAACICHFFS